MTISKKTLLAAGAAVGAVLAFALYTGKAHAGEKSDWTGPYIGVIGAYDQTDLSGTLATINGVTDPDLKRKASINGGLFGLQAGYGKQFGMLYAGVETDWSFGDSSKSVADKDVDGLTMKYKADQFGTIRGRLGFIVDQWMPYVTGGVGIKHGSIGANIDDGFDKINLETESWNVGYVLGGGLEWRPAEHWAFKVEALYSNFGENSLLTASGFGEKINILPVKDTGTEVRAAVAYKF